MKYGAHTLMWTSVFSEKDMYLFDMLKDIGFDGVEIKLSDLSILPVSKIKKKIQQKGTECTFTSTLDENSNISSEDPSKRKRAFNIIKERLDIVSEIGSDILGGSMYTAWGYFTGRSRTDAEWSWCKDSLFEVGEYAKSKGVVIALEPLNRYETYFLNTVEDTKKLIKEIGHSNIKMLLDTYHLNIEENSFYDSIKFAGEDLYHLHLCENNRGIPGEGHVNWSEVFKAIKEINYQRWAVIESFVPSADEEISSRVRLWRRVAPSAKAIAENGLAFFKKMEIS